jgi:anaerobic magnesium-protoporphyrin IX monomethyl ester cyclase
MIDVLLTHSYHLAFDRKQVRKMQPYAPLATLYAAALLRQRGYSVAVFDTMLRSPDEFESCLKQMRPKIVALYEDNFNYLSKMCLTRMREVAWQLLDASKKAGAVSIAHGSDITDNQQMYLERGFDYVLLGEAEATLLALVESISARRPSSEILGVVTRDMGEQRRPVVRPMSPLNELPLPARDLVDMAAYRKAWQRAHGVFSVNMVASRGCPFQCNWCAKPVFGDRFALRAAVDVAIEMKMMRQWYGAEHIWFADDIFGLNRHWVEDLAREVELRECGIPFKIQSRADLMSEETVDALRRSGCAEVWMGVESGSQRILDAMNKDLKVEEVIVARQRLGAAGIRACFFLQLGYAGETWDDIAKTIALVKDTRPDDIGVSFSYPLPNTRFHEKVREQLGAKRNWEDSDDLCVMFHGTYTDQFYRDIRDALHAEVDSWRETKPKLKKLAAMWQHVYDSEALSRNPNPTFPVAQTDFQSFVPVTHLAQAGD